MQQKCSISLHIQVLPETWQTGMDLIDLTRILGILIDNAIEEVLLVPDASSKSALQEMPAAAPIQSEIPLPRVQSSRASMPESTPKERDAEKGFPLSVNF